MQIDTGISEVSVVTFSGGAARPLPGTKVLAQAGIPQSRSKTF